jgi:hypothetical protein
VLLFANKEAFTPVPICGGGGKFIGAICAIPDTGAVPSVDTSGGFKVKLINSSKAPTPSPSSMSSKSYLKSSNILKASSN